MLSVEDGAGWEGSSQHTTTFPDLGLPLVRSVTQQLLSAAMSQAWLSGMRCKNENASPHNYIPTETQMANTETAARRC